MIFAAAAPGESQTIRDDVRQALETTLQHHTIDPWYPAAIDVDSGGYFSNFDYQWNRKADQEKFIVTQARHVWTLSTLAEFFPDNSQYTEYAAHGYRFLRDKMWDVEHGGFFQLVGRTGEVIGDPGNIQKRAYGNAFGLYALSAFYRISENEEVLNFAIEAFHWLDRHARDPAHGGYFECLNRDGSVVMYEQGFSDASAPWNAGLKDFNSSIHLLEAFAELYKVWPDTLVRARLEVMVHVVADIMVHEKGFLQLYFHPDWRLVTDAEMDSRTGRGEHFNHLTFGHDVETAYLLSEALRLLGEHITGPRKTKIKLLVDHPLAHGWDPTHGGFYDMGRYEQGEVVIVDAHKSWWAQAEALNALHMMALLYPEDPRDYRAYYAQMWVHIDQYLIDHTFAGWYHRSLDTAPEAREGDKASIWKGNYHTARSLINCLQREQ
jgi:mannobiose 2-epimerase